MKIYNVLIALCICTFFSFVSSDSPEALKDLVTDLPGQSHVSFKHYAGYVPVNKTNGRAMFYWFFEATSLPNQKPLVLWLNGGPGCSSVGYGATQEIGPFLVDNKGTSLTFNPYAWNHEANMLFLESPVGVGFSYSNTTSDYKKIGDDFTARDAYAFIQKWLERFPAYRENDFYMAGESYAGKYIPELAEFIYDKNNDNSSLHIKLKGILVPRMMGGYDPCLDDYTRVFYNRADVQKALHASDGIHLKNWTICNGDTDGRVPVLATRYCINKLELPIKTSWRAWYHEKQVSGWLQEYEGLTFTTFKGAGHDVPSFKPSESLAFFSAFLKGVPPPLSL
ncbi:unnamed protein product [Microthlaspi erraticum]|uniref:Carboxypeptidase n=1 Tax=Microthlaspi erraticum TaxID=1685480 RepID=A0A6D2IW29_9BRAS|nr:unnamed protein product [Microthlaspi erraticum]